MNRKTKHLLTLILLTFSFLANAQVYPVQVTPVLTPPYNLKLSSYATTTDIKLRVNILLRDVNEFNRQVRLKLIIKGQGLNIQSQQFVNGASPIYLNGGTNQELTNLDLRPYFQLNNLLGINPQQYNRPLPDGQYNFCFEVYDFFTNQLISNTGCFPVFLIVNDPPFLNVPQRGEQIVLKDHVNIIFQWTPRHLNATNVTYEFEIREIWDNLIDPQAGFLASPPLYSETTRATTFLYNNTKPALLPDKTYAWRVRAISTTGISENSIFRNNGYSEIYNFRTTQNCDAPKYPLSEAISKSTVKLNWQGNLEHNKYHVQYRKVSYTKETEKQKENREKKNKKRAKKGQKEKEYTSKKENFEWFEVYTFNEQAQISNLEAGQTYEFRVGGTCTSLTEFKQYYSYTNTNEFTMPTEEETVNYNCGVLPDIQIANQDPIQNIGVNETFTAGDFPVTVKEVQNNGGKFTGKGFIVVPYLADTKIAVAFEGITINTNYQLIEGVVKTTYDPTFKNVESIDEFVNSIADLIKKLLDSFNGTEEQINQLEELQEQYGNEIAEALNNPDIPDELKEDIKGSWEKGGQAFDTLMASANEFGEGGPNGEGYDDLSSGASDGINESDIALEKAYDVAFVVEAQRILNSEDAEQLFWETLEKVEEVYEFFKQCHSEGWTSYESKGFIPYCFWRDSEINPDEILSENDTPYVAGIFDGIYQEGKAIVELPEMINKLDEGIHQLFYAYTIAYLKCRDSKVQANQYRFEELLKKLEVESKQEGIWNWVKKKWNDYEGEKEDVAEYLKECDEAEKTRQAVNELYELVNSWEDIKNLYAAISSKIKELYDLYNTESSINEERYKKGILDIQILSTAVPIAGQLTKISKVKKLLQTLKNFTKNQWDDLGKKYGDKLANALINIPTKYRVSIFEKVKIIAKDETLLPKTKASFLDSYYYTGETIQDIGVFRRFGGNENQAKLFGGFSTTEAVLSRNDLAILKKWSTMQFEAELIVEKGAKLNMGKIAQQSIYSGGADQVLLPRNYPEYWVKSVKNLKTGKVYSLEEFKIAFPNQI